VSPVTGVIVFWVFKRLLPAFPSGNLGYIRNSCVQQSRQRVSLKFQINVGYQEILAAHFCQVGVVPSAKTDVIALLNFDTAKLTNQFFPDLPQQLHRIVA
jgi:hypothetical protein